MGFIQGLEDTNARLTATLKKATDAANEAKNLKATIEDLLKRVAFLPTRATAASVGMVNSLNTATKQAQATLLKTKAIDDVEKTRLDADLTRALAQVDTAAWRTIAAVATAAGGGSTGDVTQAHGGAHYIVTAADITLSAEKKESGKVSSGRPKNGEIEIYGEAASW